jgi:hypothetical protein
MHLFYSLSGMPWFNERYPELQAHEEPQTSMSQFDFLMCINCGLAEHRAAPFYSILNRTRPFALRVHDDDALRAQIARAMGYDLSEFDSGLQAAFQRFHRFQGAFIDDSPQALLRGRQA